MRLKSPLNHLVTVKRAFCFLTSVLWKLRCSSCTVYSYRGLRIAFEGQCVDGYGDGDRQTLPLNSPAGCTHTTGALWDIHWHGNLHYQPLLQCGGAPQIFPGLVLAARGIKLSAVRSCDSCLSPPHPFFFSPPSKLKGRSRAAEGLRLSSFCSLMQPFRPLFLHVTVRFSLAVAFPLQPFPSRWRELLLKIWAPKSWW